MNKSKLIAIFAMLATSTVAFSQTPPREPLHDVAQLSASASVDVTQDRLSIRLGTTRDGNDAAAVQAQLSQALDAALAEARSAAQPGKMEPRSGSFSLGPRYTNDGKINGWRGSVDMSLEGSDFSRISQTAGRISTLTVSGVSFSLSREAREQAESRAQAQAIALFRQRAHQIAEGFGFSSYSLGEVNVGASDSGFGGQPRMMRAMAAPAGATASDLPVEAGKSTVTVVVSGTVQMK